MHLVSVYSLVIMQLIGSKRMALGHAFGVCALAGHTVIQVHGSKPMALGHVFGVCVLVGS